MENPGYQPPVAIGNWSRKSFPLPRSFPSGSAMVGWRCSAFTEKEVGSGDISVTTRWKLRIQLQDKRQGFCRSETG